MLGDKFILKLIWKGEIPRIVKTTYKKEEKKGRKSSHSSQCKGL